MSAYGPRVRRLTLAVGALTVLTLTGGAAVAQPADEPEAPAGGSPAAPSAPKSGAEAAGGGEAAPAGEGAGGGSVPVAKPGPPVEEADDVPGAGVDRLDPTAPLDEATKLRIFRQAQKRMEAITRAQEELAHREARLLSAQAELDRRYKSLRTIQEEMSKAQAGRSKARDDDQRAADEAAKRAAEEARKDEAKELALRKEAIEKLSSVFEKMKPSEIAKVVPEMDEELTVEVLMRLKEKTTAKVLGTVKPDLAARISENMARLKKKREAEAKAAKDRKGGTADKAGGTERGP
jgi:flagellar motility protein MotE (MotC chaperone)